MTGAALTLIGLLVVFSGWCQNCFNQRKPAMSELTGSNKDKLISDVRVVISDAEELLRMTASQAGEGAAALRGRIESGLKKARVDLAHLQDAAVVKAKAAGRATDDFVNENPWKAVGVAAGIGVVVGLLIGRR